MLINVFTDHSWALLHFYYCLRLFFIQFFDIFLFLQVLWSFLQFWLLSLWRLYSDLRLTAGKQPNLKIPGFLHRAVFSFRSPLFCVVISKHSWPDMLHATLIEPKPVCCNTLPGFKVSIFENHWFLVQSWKIEKRAFFGWALVCYYVPESFRFVIGRGKDCLILRIDFLQQKNLLGRSCCLFPRAGSFIVIFCMSNDRGCWWLSALLLHWNCWTGTNKYYWVYKYNRKQRDLKVCLGQKFREME